MKQDELYFDGETYSAPHDRARLGTQLARVHRFMLDEQWHTLKEIHASCGGSEAGVSARLRDLRKPRFGAQNVEHVRIGGGLWKYRLRLREQP